jgi:hypothetical protein
MYTDYRELAIKLGYSYINGGYGYWEDGAGKIHSFDSMDNEYLSNCLNFVNKGINELIENKGEIKRDIKRQLHKIVKNPDESDINDARLQIIEILKEKKQELQEYINKRKSF